MERTYCTPKPNIFTRIFWSAAGADQYLLERSTYSDQIKVFCMGGLVLATALMAGLSGGYAFYTIFEPKGSLLGSDIHEPTLLKACVFGIVWGLIIFNIDRFIVSSTSKGDGTESITWKKLKSALPRIIMGAIISITISKPMEIRMFKPEIDAQLHARQLEQQAEYKKRIEANNRDHIVTKETEISRLRQELQSKQKQLDDLNVELQTEIQGRSKSGKSGDGPAANAIRGNISRVEAELAVLREQNGAEIQRAQADKNTWEEKIKEELATGEKAAAGLDGLLERLKISHEISGFWISLFITLLFMSIELTPIFFKMMLTKGPYDYLEENAKESVKAENGIVIQYRYYKDDHGQEHDQVTYLDSHNRKEQNLSQQKMDAELAQYAYQHYREREMRRIEADPERYLQERGLVKEGGSPTRRTATPAFSTRYTKARNNHYHDQA